MAVAPEPVAHPGAPPPLVSAPERWEPWPEPAVQFPQPEPEEPEPEEPYGGMPSGSSYSSLTPPPNCCGCACGDGCGWLVVTDGRCRYTGTDVLGMCGCTGDPWVAVPC